MNEKTRALAIAGGGAAAAFLAAVRRGLFAAQNGGAVALCLCDGAFIGAVFFGGLGALCWVRNQGFFDNLVFGAKTIFSLRKRKPGTYAEGLNEYKKRREGKRRPARPWLLTGAALLLAAFCFLGAYALSAP